MNWSADPIREYRDAIGVDERIGYAAWLWQLNRGIFKSPWAKWESWTISVAHDEADADRYVENFAGFAEAITPDERRARSRQPRLGGQFPTADPQLAEERGAI